MPRNFILALLIIMFAANTDLFSQSISFAAIGDYGRWYTEGESEVSRMVHAWSPDFIITLGDNNYEYGADSTIDSNIGQYYHDYIHPYNGIFGAGALFNKFFPALGNHDWITVNALPYLNYFTLPGNERYYDFIKGNCHFFVVDSDVNEPDGNTIASRQANWLRSGLSSSTARFKIVYFHHPPYSSGQHGNNTDMQWPFKEWGATIVLCGHEHNYERLVGNDGMTYFINGLGGKDWRDFGTIVPESRFRFTGNYGAMIMTSYSDSINIKFYAVPDSLKDDTTIILPPIGLIQVSNTIPDGFSLGQNYPNPFNPATNFEFRIAEFGFVMLTIYDATGSEVETLINEQLNAGTYKANWNASRFSGGIYFYKLTAGNFSEAKKMILIK